MSHVIKDFGDWLSPIIVKELRQGLRTRLFTGAFIVLQGMMVLCMLGGMGANTDDSVATGFFWAFIAFTLVFVMPLRGFGSLSNEIRLDTMDLISLTRMSAYRIVFGKWAALVSQSVLLVTAVLPYVVLRYFFGGVNVVAELAFLGFGLLASGLISAVMVCFSSFQNFLVRVIMALAVCIFVIIYTSAFVTMGYQSSTGIPFANSWEDLWAYLGMIALIFFMIWYLLSMAATRIATEAANYSTGRRIGAILVTVILGLLPMTLGVPVDFTWGIATVLLSIFGLDAATETPSTVRSLHESFFRYGIPGRLAGAVLSPGWASGTLFVILLGGISFGLTIGDPVHMTTLRSLVVHVALVNSILFPLLIVHLFFPKTEHLLPAWFFVQFGVGIVSIFLIAITESMGNSVTILASPLPPVATFLAMNDNTTTDEPILLIISLVLLGLALLLTLWRAAPLLKTVKRYRNEYRIRGESPSQVTVHSAQA